MIDKGPMKQWKHRSSESEQNSNGGERNTAANTEHSGTFLVKAPAAGWPQDSMAREGGNYSQHPHVKSTMAFLGLLGVCLEVLSVEQVSDRAGETWQGSDQLGIRDQRAKAEAKALLPRPLQADPLISSRTYAPPLSGALA